MAKKKDDKAKIQNIINAERYKKSNQYNLTEFVNKFRD